MPQKKIVSAADLVGNPTNIKNETAKKTSKPVGVSKPAGASKSSGVSKSPSASKPSSAKTTGVNKPSVSKTTSASKPAGVDKMTDNNKATVVSSPRAVNKTIIKAKAAPVRRSTVRRASSSSARSNGYSRSSSTGSRFSKNYSSRNSSYRSRSMPDANLPTETIKGILDTSRDGHGILRTNFSESDTDAYISASQIRRFNLKPGDVVVGLARKPKENERFWGLLKVEKINDLTPEEMNKTKRQKFMSLTPVYPDSQIKLEIDPELLDLRIIDLVAPIGKGQRSLIVSPPKAGKTNLLKNVATGVAKNHPEIHLMAVLVGERPEEVTDIRRHIADLTDGNGDVAASNFDESAQSQCRVAELALERAKRLVEQGKDVLILLDSITRLARAYNLAMPTSGRTLSGGFDPAALFPPKRFFGAARNFEVDGSLTIVGTALVDTGSRMDDLVYEEFKGTGNQEVHLDRKLAERRIYPAIDARRSSTRRDDLLIDGVTYQSVLTLHRMLDTFQDDERTNTLIGQLKRTKNNKEFLAGLNK